MNCYMLRCNHKSYGYKKSIYDSKRFNATEIAKIVVQLHLPDDFVNAIFYSNVF